MARVTTDTNQPVVPSEGRPAARRTTAALRKVQAMPLYGKMAETDPVRWAELTASANAAEAAREFAVDLGHALKSTLEAAGWVRWRENEIEPPDASEVVLSHPRTWRDRRVVRFLYVGGEAEITVLMPEQRGSQLTYREPGVKFRIWGPPDVETERSLVAFLQENGVRLPADVIERPQAGNGETHQ